MELLSFYQLKEVANEGSSGGTITLCWAKSSWPVSEPGLFLRDEPSADHCPALVEAELWLSWLRILPAAGVLVSMFPSTGSRWAEERPGFKPIWPSGHPCCHQVSSPGYCSMVLPVLTQILPWGMFLQCPPGTHTLGQFLLSGGKHMYKTFFFFPGEVLSAKSWAPAIDSTRCERAREQGPLRYILIGSLNKVL